MGTIANNTLVLQSRVDNATHSVRTWKANPIITPNPRFDGDAVIYLQINNEDGTVIPNNTPLPFIPSLDGTVRPYVFTRQGIRTAIPPNVTSFALYAHHVESNSTSSRIHNYTLLWTITFSVGRDITVLSPSPPLAVCNCSVDVETTQTVVRTATLNGQVLGTQVGASGTTVVNSGILHVETILYLVSFDLTLLINTTSERLLPSPTKIDLYVNDPNDLSTPAGPSLQATVPLLLLCNPVRTPPAQIQANVTNGTTALPLLSVSLPFQKARPFADASVLPGVFAPQAYLAFPNGRILLPTQTYYSAATLATIFRWDDRDDFLPFWGNTTLSLVTTSVYFSDVSTALAYSSDTTTLNGTAIFSIPALICDGDDANAWYALNLSCIAKWPSTLTPVNLTLRATLSPARDPLLGNHTCNAPSSSLALLGNWNGVLGPSVGNVRVKGNVTLTLCDAVSSLCATARPIQASVPDAILAQPSYSLLASIRKTDVQNSVPFTFFFPAIHRAANTRGNQTSAWYTVDSSQAFAANCTKNSTATSTTTTLTCRSRNDTVVDTAAVFIYREAWILPDNTSPLICVGNTTTAVNWTAQVAVVNDLSDYRDRVLFASSFEANLELSTNTSTTPPPPPPPPPDIPAAESTNVYLITIMVPMVATAVAVPFAFGMDHLIAIFAS